MKKLLFICFVSSLFLVGCKSYDAQDIAIIKEYIEYSNNEVEEYGKQQTQRSLEPHRGRYRAAVKSLEKIK